MFCTETATYEVKEYFIYLSIRWFQRLPVCSYSTIFVTAIKNYARRLAGREMSYVTDIFLFHLKIKCFYLYSKHAMTALKTLWSRDMSDQNSTA